MRIDRLTIRNFKGFQLREFQFHPQFNLLTGVNGSGKTSILEALSVAAGAWLLGIRGFDTRHIQQSEVRLLPTPSPSGQLHWEAQFPCEIEAHGEIGGQPLSWRRSLNSPAGRTTHGDAKRIKDLAAQADSAVRAGQPVTLPLLSFYGTGRLWNVPRDQYHVKSESQLIQKQSRFQGYRNSVDPRIAVGNLTRWIALQSWIGFQQGGAATSSFSAVRHSILASIPGAKDISFDARRGEVIVDISGNPQPFQNLSDGQRCALAMVADIACKASTLNPHLGEHALTQTPGIVLIDELDLHLHPTWQRRVIEDLRRVFPLIQFFATSHSPFLIQSLRSGEELQMLDGGAPTAQLANKPLAEIAYGIMGVPLTEVSQRYQEMKDIARRYLEALESPSTTDLALLQAQFTEAIRQYDDNPAYQALLEMERQARKP